MLHLKRFSQAASHQEPKIQCFSTFHENVKSMWIGTLQMLFKTADLKSVGVFLQFGIHLLLSQMKIWGQTIAIFLFYKK